MRRLLLLLALCMALTLAFAPMALAQDDLNCGDLSEAEEQAVFDADPSDPNNLDDDDDDRPCEDDTSDNGSFDVGGSQYETETGPTTASPSDELPDTGGSSFVALGLPTLTLLVASGILALRIVRR